MAAFLDVCRFNPTLGGTTNWTFSTAVTGYQSPAAAGVVNGRLYKYRAESADLSQWEIGEGAYNTATGVLARTTVLFNSAGTTAKISFSAVPQVAVVALKEDLILVEEANSFTAAQQAQARSNIGAGVASTPLTASLGADVAITNTTSFFDGPSVAQGTSGTWFASGTLTVVDATNGPDAYDVKLWDGTTVIASTRQVASGPNIAVSFAISGVITNPAGNIRISVKNANNATSSIKFNLTGNSKDSTITAVRIG